MLFGTLEEQAIELIDNTGLTYGTVARLVGPPMTAKYLHNKLGEHNRGRLKPEDLVRIKRALRGLANIITGLVGEPQMPEAQDLVA
jgi:hypothetical protein